MINVAGTNITFNQGNMVGARNTLFARTNVIWNFCEATNILFDHAVNGRARPLRPPPPQHRHRGPDVRLLDVPAGEVHLPGYTGLVPTPGAVALLGLAGLAGPRRRR